MKEKQQNFKKWLMFIFALIISTTITFLPTLIFKGDIRFDVEKFVNLWIELFGGGIIIALMFYAITQVITYTENKNEDKRYLNQIIFTLGEIKDFFQNKRYDKKHSILISYKMIFLNIQMINNKKVRLLLHEKLLTINDSIESEISQLDSDTDDTRHIENKVENIIKTIVLWKTK